VRAVDGVDVKVEAGRAVGIVGESGSGKSVLSMTILGLIASPPAVVSADAVEFEGVDLRTLSPAELRQRRGNRMAMIFQDPMTSLNPFLTIGDQISEPLIVHGKASSSQAWKRAVELLAEVGIADPARRARDYPHHFSGGMRQRAMVAMALACNPALLIADEPTTALDVTIQAQILELMQRVRRDHGASVVLITHDLGVAAGFCDEIYVMYAGRIVEKAPTARLFAAPAHPYTKALLASVPRLDDDRRERFQTIGGAPPDLTKLPVGCAFAPRCPYVVERCKSERPTLDPLADEPDRHRACFVEIRPPATTNS
ncbi:MAG: ABC transporter ATP-binding protein, partial [Planctomycetia bacterium]